MNKSNAIYKVYDKIKNDKIFVYASHASFYMLISAIPFVTLSVYLIKQFLSISEKDISEFLLKFFPNATKNIVDSIINEILEKTSGGFISFSIISLLWTSSRGIAAIRRGLRKIYNLKSISFFRDLIYCIIQLFFMVLVIYLLLLIAILPNIFSYIGFFIFLFLFTIIYFLFTDRNVSFKVHVPGSIAASLSWIIFARLFSLYIKHFANYSKIYGSLTAVFIIALWIYFSTIIFFLGAELNTIISSNIFKISNNKKELF